MKINLNKKRVDIKVKQLSLLGRLTGLMFKSKNTENLLFEFGSPKIRAIHSFFVFFPFLAVWLDEKNQVVETHEVKPFTSLVKSKKPITKLIEIPLNKNNKQITDLIVGRKDLNTS